MLDTIRLTEFTPQLETFCEACASMNYTNNASRKAIKFDWCLEEGGSWWATVKDNKIISLSGIHPFLDGYRALFRGVQIETRPYKGLNRYQKQNYAFYDHMVKQIEWSKSNNIYITTSPVSVDDRSGKMSRIHNSAKVLEKQGVFEYIKDDEVFYVQQSIWKLNIGRYYEIRK
jgi:hypothetical protein